MQWKSLKSTIHLYICLQWDLKDDFTDSLCFYIQNASPNNIF